MSAGQGLCTGFGGAVYRLIRRLQGAADPCLEGSEAHRSSRAFEHSRLSRRAVTGGDGVRGVALGSRE